MYSVFQIKLNKVFTFFTKEIVVFRWQLNLFGFLMFCGGILAAFTFISKQYIFPKIFATSSPWTQTDWSGGQGSSSVNQYSSASGVDATRTAGQISLANTEKFTNVGFETNLTSWTSFSATGGTISTANGYTIHTFTTSGTFTPNGAGNVEYLVVAGGGGGGGGSEAGGYTGGGGGGAGGLLSGSLSVTNSALTVTIGAGGSGGAFNITDNSGVSGSNSTFSTVTALGGGGGGSGGDAANATRIGKSGSSGGGSGYRSLVGGNGTSGQGFAGGSAGSQEQGSGAGGGAGGVGGNGPQTPNQYMGGAGGVGLSSSITGTSIFYAGGGGGGGLFLGTYLGYGGNAGTGGGGIGGYNLSSIGVYSGTNGAANSGGGGGGGTRHTVYSVGGNGGSGIVIIRYPAFTTTRDTSIKYAGVGSAKLVNGGTAQNFTQSVNVGDTNTYNLTAYVYTTGSEVTSADAELFYNDAVITTTYTAAGGGWYKLSGTLTGANASRNYGVQLKANKTIYVDDFSLNNFSASGTVTSNIFDSGNPSDWGNLTYTSSGTGTVTVKVRTSNSDTMVGAPDWTTCSAKSSGADLSGGCVVDMQRYVQYQVTLTTTDTSLTPIFSDINIAFSASDNVKPTANASSVVMVGLGNTAWAKTAPTINWSVGADNIGGVGLLGYCLSLDESDIGTTNLLDPETDGGKLTGINDGVAQTYCPYIVTGTSVNLSTIAGLSLTSNKQYYFSLKAVDLTGNIYTGGSNTFQDIVSFKYDAAAPTNVTYISTAGGNFSNVTDMSFTWPIGGNGMSLDNQSGVLGWQYQINSTDGAWLGSAHSDSLNLDYIPVNIVNPTVNLSAGTSIVSGSNTVYFRTVDQVGNFSSNATIRTGALNFGGAAPTFDGNANVAVTPQTSSTNQFALSWPQASAADNRSITHYYYMVNTPPPSSLDTLLSNSSTYIDAGTRVEIATKTLHGVNKGTNTVYVVAIDSAATPNYSPSNYISGTFTLNSTDPDNAGNLVASDSSIKSQSLWNITLSWTKPIYQGAGNLTYDIYRSSDNHTFTKSGSTSGLSYVDNTATSARYYYKIYTKDGADATSSGTNAVSIIPTGKWTSAPSLDSGPTVSSVTTKKATIAWGTSRPSDSKIQFGVEVGKYYAEEPSNSTQTASHTINLTNLTPGTTYYYKAKWTDEDGNTGISDEKSFTTDPAPTITDPKAKSISLASAIIEYKSKGATKVKIYYGKTTSFGGLKEISTSTSETIYTTELIGLEDGTKYYYKINTFDSESSEYEGNTLTFETLPRPRISNVRVQEVRGTAQPTMLITWTTNTEVSSIVTYYPQARPEDARDEINVALVKGEHKIIVKGLVTHTPYYLIVKGRDKAGNEAQSDRQQFDTATDTRPPSIIDLKVQGSTQTFSSSQEQQTQLVVSWNTDEPASSQVEYGEGSGTTYSQKTQQDSNLTVNHLVVISGLSPSKVYHLKALSQDSAGNLGNSIDTVTITPKASDNALNLVITNLQQAFGFLGGLKK